MAVMQPDSFVPWTPNAARQAADFTVRPATPGDIEACVRLVATIGAGPEARWRDTLTRTVHDGQDRALFVAEVAGAVIGYGRVVSYRPDPAVPKAAPPGWYLLGLVVDPAWRRRGIGEALTRARMAWVVKRADHLYYFTAPANRSSQELHQRLGFVPLSGTWIPPGGTPADAGTQRFTARPSAAKPVSWRPRPATPGRFQPSILPSRRVRRFCSAGLRAPVRGATRPATWLAT